MRRFVIGMVVAAVGSLGVPANGWAQEKVATLTIEKPAAGWVHGEGRAGGHISCAEGCTVATFDVEPGALVTLVAESLKGVTVKGWEVACVKPDPAAPERCRVRTGAAGEDVRVPASFADELEGQAEPPFLEAIKDDRREAFGPDATFEFSAAVKETSDSPIARVEYRLVFKDVTFAVEGRNPDDGFRASFDVNGIPEGTYLFTASVFDAGGREGRLDSGQERKVVIDRTGPSLIRGTGPAGLVAAATFDVAQNEDGGFTCTDNGAGFACGGAATVSITRAFAQGAHTVVVTPVDAAGNAGKGKSFTFTLDSIAPAITFGSHPDPFTTAVATIPFSVADASAATTTCRRNSEPGARACSAPDADTFNGASSGSHTLTVRAVDAAGNVSEATRPFRVQIPRQGGPAAPETRILAGPAEGTVVVGGTTTFGLESDDQAARLSCRVYLKGTPPPAFAPCSGPGARHTVTNLPPGSWILEVVSTSADGVTDPTPVARGFVVPGGSQGGTADKAAGLVKATFGKGRVTIVKSLKVTGLASGAKVFFTCKGGGCPKGLKVPAVKAGAVDLSALLKKKKLKPGAVLVVRITQPGASERVVRFTTVRNKQPRRS